MPLTIEIQDLQTKIQINPAGIKTDIRKVLKKIGLVRGHLSFVFVDDRKIKMLNQKYLRHDYATDVLTFDMGSKAVLEAEIIISAQTAQRNAAEYGVSVKSEIVLYMIHGVLHVLGYDDHTPSGIKKMRRKEAELMKLAQAKES